MSVLWAPWRHEYLTAEKTDGCVLCAAAGQGVGREPLVLAVTPFSMIMLNRYPYIGGHLMIVPLRHISDPDLLDNEELLDLMHAVRRARSALARCLSPDGFNIGMNLGRAAGAGLDTHLHIHVVPRWNGDANFMQSIGHTRVISLGLTESYELLQRALAG